MSPTVNMFEVTAHGSHIVKILINSAQFSCDKAELTADTQAGKCWVSVGGLHNMLQVCPAQSEWLEME